MKSLSKLLLLKNQRDHSFARSWIVDDSGLYGRTVDDSTLLGSMLRAEQFDVVLIDQRDSDDDLIETLEGVRQYQPQSKLIVVSDKIALQQVVQAMRFNVRDIFQPPFNPGAVAARIESDLAEKAGGRPRPEKEALVRWSDLLGSIDAVANGHAPVNGHNGHAVAAVNRVAGSNGHHDDAALRRALEQRGREVEDLQMQLEKSRAAQARLSGDLDRLSAGNGASKSDPAAEAQVKALREEVETLRARLKSGNGANGAANTSQEIVALQNEIEFHVSNAAKLQEQLAISAVAHAEVTKEVARLGSIEVKLQRSESQLAAARASLKEFEAQLATATGDTRAAREEAAEAAKARELAETALRSEKERIAQLEAEITSERERIAAREAEASVQVAAANRREEQARGELERERSQLDEVRAEISRDQSELKRHRDLLDRRDHSLKELGRLLDERETRLKEQAELVAATGGEIDEHTAAVIRDATTLAARIQELDEHRLRLLERVERARAVAKTI